MLGPVTGADAADEQENTDDCGVLPFPQGAESKSGAVKKRDTCQQEESGEKKASTAHKEDRQIDDGKLHAEVGRAPGEIDEGKADR